MAKQPIDVNTVAGLVFYVRTILLPDEQANFTALSNFPWNRLKELHAQAPEGTNKEFMQAIMNYKLIKEL